MTREDRQRAAFWAGALGLVLVAAAGYGLLLGAEPGAEPPPAPAAAPPAAPGLRVASASGPAWIVRGGARAAAAAGDALGRDDVLETEEGGRLELAAGESYRIVMDGAAQVDVEELTAELSRFRLDEGVVSARVRDDPARAVEIAGADGSVARTRGGEVSVVRAGDALSVGVTRGLAVLTSGGADVDVRAGETSRAERGGPPAPPRPLPPSLLLQVGWPDARATNRRRIVVTGRTDPGALLVVGGKRVDVGADGRFEQVVYLREGEQRVRAVARDAAGRRAVAESPPLVLDTRPPDAEFDTKELWSRPRRAPRRAHLRPRRRRPARSGGGPLHRS